MLHIGYILLLDRFDEADPEYGTVMARFLREVQGRGIRTSIDVVSDSSANYAEKILPALRYCNYAIVNEIECCSIFGLPAANADGSPNEAGIRPGHGGHGQGRSGGKGHRPRQTGGVLPGRGHRPLYRGACPEHP